MIHTLLENDLKLRISHLKGDDFQEFYTVLMHLLHGSDGFTDLRRTHDQGADGFLEKEEAVIACWGPQIMETKQHMKAFKIKVDGDYSSYQKNWESRYPKWKFIVNHSPNPDQKKYVRDLNKECVIVGLDAIVRMIIHDLPSAKRRQICSKINVPAELLRQDHLIGLFEDILTTAENGKSFDYSEKPLFISEKIELNFNSCEVSSCESEYEMLQEKYWSVIKESLISFDDDEHSRIKSRVVSDYNISHGNSFAEKFNHQTLIYLTKYGDQDDEYKELIRAIQFYFFELCLYGKKTQDGF